MKNSYMLSENIISLHSYSCCKTTAHTRTRATLLPSEQTSTDTRVVVVKQMSELKVQTAGTKGFRTGYVFLTAVTFSLAGMKFTVWRDTSFFEIVASFEKNNTFQAFFAHPKETQTTMVRLNNNIQETNNIQEILCQSPLKTCNFL